MYDWSTLTVPLSGGLQQKGDKRAQNPPALDKCVDVEFDDIGGLRTRKPFAAVGVNILGGGTLSNMRTIVDNDGELLCFTVDSLYSWSAADSAWVLKGTYLAAKVDESPAFVTTDDQIDCDRAELSGVVLYVWTGSSTVYAAAMDKESGAPLVAPTAITTSPSVGARPRVVACSTKILLFYSDAGNLKVKAIDPANVATSLASAATTLVAYGIFNANYDVVAVPGADQVVGACENVTTTAYTTWTVTSALSVTSVSKSRTCDGPIAVSCTPDGTHVQVVRANGTNIQGDLLTLALADVYTGQAIGTTSSTPVNQIAACHRTTQDSGHYRCYAFWSSQESDTGDADFQMKSNWVDDGDNLGTQGTLVERLGVASRAFAYSGHVFVWGVFSAASGSTVISDAGQTYTTIADLQNTYFLYRDDALLCGKSAMFVAGGFSPSTGHLPGVALTSGSTGFSWCATQRRAIELGGVSRGYAARSPLDVTITFDSNEARRSARIGRTLYIPGAEVLQYDGTQLTEVGFHIYPWYFQFSTGTGSLANGDYAYKFTWRWDNAQGELDRSTTATTGVQHVASGPEGTLLLSLPPLPVTHKTVSAPAVEWWRTAANPPDDAPFYLVTSTDPASTGANAYIANQYLSSNLASGQTDAYADSDATTKETNPENDGVLEALAPPAASIIAVTDTRVFLAGVAGDPDRVWYSKQRNDGEVAAFNDALVAPVPAPGGAITGLAFLNETLVVFRERAIYTLPGDGYDNTGGGNNYGPAVLVSTDVGAVVQESIAVVPMGLIFKSSKGWYLLDRSWEVQYIGDKVSDYDSETPLAVHVMAAQHQVRILTANRLIVWDYLVGQWGEWSISGGLSACVSNGTYYYLTSSGPMVEQADFSGGVTYGMDIETAWVKPADFVGRCRLRWIMPLGEYRSACSVRVRVARNYQSDGAGGWLYDTDVYRTPATVVGGPLQVRLGPKNPNLEAVKIRLTACSTAKDGTAPTGEAMKLTAIGVEYGVMPGLTKRLAAAQKE